MTVFTDAGPQRRATLTTNSAIAALAAAADMPAWHRDAACTAVDPELFFPGRGDSTEPAKQVCAGCPVRSECLEHALDHGEKWGIWGGTSGRERRRIRRQRARGREAAA